MAPKLLKGWRCQGALRSLKGWHWLKGAERVGAGSEALKGPAAPGSLEDPAMTEALKMGKSLGKAEALVGLGESGCVLALIEPRCFSA